jgi:hypothetical protein
VPHVSLVLRDMGETGGPFKRSFVFSLMTEHKTAPEWATGLQSSCARLLFPEPWLLERTKFARRLGADTVIYSAPPVFSLQINETICRAATPNIEGNWGWGDETSGSKDPSRDQGQSC